MITNYLKLAAGFLFFLLLQVLVLNNISYAGWGTPFLYLYFLITLPNDLSRNAQLTFGLVMGLAVDLFCNTPGMNAFASVVAMTLRPHLLSLFGTRDELESFTPSFASYGAGSFLRYTFVMVLVHHFSLFAIQLFSMNDVATLALRTLASGAVTYLLILIVESLKNSSK